MRRPATPEDQTDVRDLSRLPAHDIYIDYVRVAHSASGRAFYVIAARNTNLYRPQPQRCLTAVRTRLLRLLRGQPKPVRSQALKIWGQLRYGREHASSAPTEGLFLFEKNEGGRGGGGGGGSLELFRRNGSFMSSGNNDTAELSGLVPDGVATVTLEYAKSVSRGPYYKPRVYPSTFERTVHVQENVLAVHVPRAAGDAIATRMVWRAADGSIVRVVKGRFG